MTALLGKTLLFAGCTAFGLLRGSRLRQRTACLGEFRRTLAGLARELAFSLRPVSDLMASAEAGTQGPTQALEGLLRGLEGQAAEAAETARRLCRVYLALGLAAGLFCLILL